MASGLHNVTQRHKCCISDVLCADLFPPNGQMPMTRFPLNMLRSLQRWCFHPAEVGGGEKKVNALLLD